MTIQDDKTNPALKGLPEDWLSSALEAAPKTTKDIIAEGRGGEIPVEMLAQGARGVAAMPASVLDLLAVPFSALGFDETAESLTVGAEGLREGAYKLAGGEYDSDLGNLFLSQVGGGLGSAAGFIGGGAGMRAVSALAGMGMTTGTASGLVGAMQMGPSQYFEAKAHGANEGEALLALAIGSGAGLTERYGVVGDILGRLDRRTGGEFGRNLRSLATEFTRGALREAPEEAIQEIVQSTIQDVGASVLYDSEREILGAETWEAGGVGAIVGLLLGGGGGAMSSLVDAPGAKDGPQAKEDRPKQEPLDGVQPEKGQGTGAIADGDAAQGQVEPEIEGGSAAEVNQVQDREGVSPEPQAQETGEEGAEKVPTVSTGDQGKDRVVTRAIQAYAAQTGVTPTVSEPSEDYEQASLDYLDSRGVDAVFVEGLAPGLPGAEVGGVVLLPKGQPKDILRGIVRHEAFHTIDQETKQEVIRRLREVSPDLYRKAREAYQRGYSEATGGEELSGDLLGEEAAAQEVEFLTGILDAIESNPEAVADAVTRDPGLFAWIADRIRRVLAGMGLADSPEAKRLQEFIRATAVTDVERSAASSAALAQQAVDAAETISLALKAAEGRVAESLAEADPKFAAAFHGTPHDFDKFDLSKIGTGEGAYNYVIFDDADVEIEAKFAVGSTINVDGQERPTTNSDGKPIATTEEALRAFWRWFGDSKVVDKDGRPMVVYHGTPDSRGLVAFDATENVDTIQDLPTYTALQAELEEARGTDRYFEILDQLSRLRVWEERTKPAFFSKSRSVASTYADDHRAFDYQGAEPEILEVYLSLRDPEEINARGLSWGQRGGPSTQGEQIAEAVSRGRDGMVIRNTLDTYNVTGSERTDVFVTFSPSQVKSATGNRGTFDPANADIRFAVNPDDVRAAKEQIDLGMDPEGKMGRSPYPRAVESADPSVQAWMRSLDEMMRAEGKPEVVSRDEQASKARKALARGRDAEIARLKGKMEAGSLLEPWEMKAVSQVLNEDFLSTDGEVIEATIELGELYRDNRTEVARALGVIREALPSTPEEKLADMLSWRSEWIEFNMARAKERHADLTLTDAQRVKARQRMTQLRALDAKKHKDAKKRLAKAGFPPDLVAQGWFTDYVDLARIGKIIGSSKGMLWDKAKEWRYISMLSNPTTWARNTWGNVANVAYHDGVEKLSRALANTIVRDPDSESLGEYAHFLHAGLKGIIPAGKAFVQGLRVGLPTFELESGRRGIKTSGSQSKIETAPQETIGTPLVTPLKKLSSHMLTAQDEGFKYFISGAETASLAYRKATKEGKRGKERQARIDELLADYSDDIHQKAYLTAKERVFQDEAGDVLSRFEGMRHSLDRMGALPWRYAQGLPIGTILAPFVRTPAKIFKVAYSDAGAPIPVLLRALSMQHFGDKTLLVKDVGRTAVSLAVWLTIFSYVFSDDDEPAITGSGSTQTGERNLEYRTGRAPYTVVTPWGRVSYRNFDPIATNFGAVVDSMEAAKAAMERGDENAIMAGLQEAFVGIFRQANDRTYLRTVSDISNLVEDSRRDGWSASARFLESQLTSFVPNVARGTARATDPYFRERTLRDLETDGALWDDFLGSVMYQVFPTPGRAPAIKHDIWGRPIRRIPKNLPRSTSVLLRMAGIEPVSSNPALRVDQAILRYNANADDPYYPSAPRPYTTIDGVRSNYTDEEYSRLMRDSGQKALEILARERIDYDNPTDDDIRKIRGALSKARRSVRDQILKDR